jgi:DNA repair exonuclease SbcCD ATPase subunit
MNKPKHFMREAPMDEHDISETNGTEVVVLDEVEQARAENVDLLATLERVEQLLTDTTESAEFWAAQARENEQLLEEKNQVIRELHTKLQEAAAHPPADNHQDAEAKPHAGANQQVDELLALSEELEREKRELKEEEQRLEEETRRLEVQMSRERAELGRQRADLQRLHGEIKHELELASREAELRTRLQPLQRKHQELINRKGGEPTREQTAPASPTPAAQPTEATREQQPGKTSGMFRRLFG